MRIDRRSFLIAMASMAAACRRQEVPVARKLLPHSSLFHAANPSAQKSWIDPRVIGRKPMSISAFPPLPGGQAIQSGQAAVSMDADTGVNNKLASLLGKPSRAATRHRNTGEAVNSLIEEPALRNVEVLSGHGAPGLIETGDGNMGLSIDGQIALWNDWAWLPHVARLSEPRISAAYTLWEESVLPAALRRLGAPHPQMPLLTLVSCSTGGGRRGAQLCQQLANIGKRNLQAWTGLIYVADNGAITFQAGSELKHFFCGADLDEASAAFAPVPESILTRGDLIAAGFDPSVALAEIRGCELTTFMEGKSRTHSLPASDAARLGAAVFFTAPYERGKFAPGKTTATARFTYRNRDPLTVELVGGVAAHIQDTNLAVLTDPAIDSILAELAL